MTIRRFDPRLAVEIRFPSYGSGYRIGGRLVLTAAHLFQGSPGSPCRVRSRSALRKVEWDVDAWVVWKASEADVALVELSENVKSIEPIVLGWFPADAGAARVRYDMYGWPKWAQTIYPASKRKAGGRHIPGEIFLADRSPEGFLVLEPERPPGVPMPGEKGSQWEGMSGAAVVCDGIVVAVQHSHQRPDRPKSLEAELLSKVFDDKGFRRLLAKHGIPLSFQEVHIPEPTRCREPPLELIRIPPSVPLVKLQWPDLSDDEWKAVPCGQYHIAWAGPLNYLNTREPVKLSNRHYKAAHTGGMTVRSVPFLAVEGYKATSWRVLYETDCRRWRRELRDRELVVIVREKPPVVRKGQPILVERPTVVAFYPPPGSISTLNIETLQPSKRFPFATNQEVRRISEIFSFHTENVEFVCEKHDIFFYDLWTDILQFSNGQSVQSVKLDCPKISLGLCLATPQRLPLVLYGEECAERFLRIASKYFRLPALEMEQL